MKKQTKPIKRTPKKANPKPNKEAPAAITASAPFPIIGIGSSAGGLEALELFLTNVPKDSGMAFVIVQHLDPTRKDLMVELLQRCTTMPVMQVKDRTPVKPNCVYVIPPNYDMSILHDVLHLLPPVEPRGLRLPIDFFLRSLAQDRQQYSIGVILSGMGSDGTLGLRAIKEKAGMIFVQELASAKFDGMPQSAIRSGLADVIAPVEALPDRILSYLRHAPMITEHGLALEDKANNGLEKVVILLRSKTGHDFSLYKKTTIYRRIERRMAIHQIEKISTYVRYLQENPQELDLLFQELLIGVTSFFRDPAAWEQLKKNMLSKLLSVRAPSQNLRAWVPAASTGEEAYSLAILFMEAMEKLKPTGNITLQIFATDLDKQAVDKAREGVYPANIAADVSAERLKRYFVKMDRGYQVIKSIREMVVFAPQNIIMDPPFTKLDILCCRNLLIYLTPELQKKLMPLFHYSLNPAGILFLGSAETVGTFNDLFTALDTKSRLYQRHASVPDPKLLEFPSKFISPRQSAELKPVKPVQNLEVLADQLLLQTYAPAAVLTNDKGDILYISGRTGKYLEPAAGKVNWNIFAMARKGISYELSGAFNKALRQKNAVTLKDLVVGTNGGKQTVEVILQPVNEPEALRGLMMVVFKDVAAPLKIKAAGKSPRTTTHSASKIADLEQEVGHARHEVQTIREEMQTSQEELKSANEELQSTNEELQSTNEELTTSKEEMQSMNEELQTINHELQSKLDELSHTNDDMKNLLDSTDIATLFLDKEMHVRRFTSQTTKVTKLIAGDVGRPITDIASDLLYAEMDQDAREVLRTLVSIEKQVATLSKRWFSVRILPYRTLHDMIDGVVITFTDITISKNLEAELRRLQTGLEKRIDDQHELLEQSDARLQLEKQRGQSGKNDETKSATEKKDTPT